MTAGGPADFAPGAGRSKAGRLLLFLFGFLLAVSLALLFTRLKLSWPLELKLLAGFFLFFLAPGILLKTLVLPGWKLLLFEWLPISIALSMAAWSAPGLIAYSREWGLDTVFAVELSIIGILFLVALSPPLLHRGRGRAGPR